MSERLKKFAEELSDNEELRNELQELVKDENDRDKLEEITIKFAKDHGYEISADDFREAEGELSDDELEAVAGGFCMCIIIGTGEEKDKICCIFGSNTSGSAPECTLLGF